MTHLKTLFPVLLFTSAAIGQSITLVHYEQLAKLPSRKSGREQQLESISFPLTEYSKSAFTYTLFRTVYLLPEDEKRLPALISFPANSSEQTRAELDFLLSLQKNRTAAEISRAEEIAYKGTWPNILNPLDSDYIENRRQLYYIAQNVHSFHPDSFPAITRLLMHCIQDIRVTEFRLKKHFVRARPYHLEPKLQPLARIHSPSFPSGHTLWAFSQALLFSEIIPEKRREFLQRAEEVRWSRELLGIHYPSDNEASKTISRWLLKFWYNNPRFVKDLKLAREEWNRKSIRL